jgi:parallel beta-helix repeat protein
VSAWRFLWILLIVTAGFNVRPAFSDDPRANNRSSVETPAGLDSGLARVTSTEQGAKQVLAAIASLPVSSTYYLDAVNGSDSNAGTSQTGAWKSLQKATNATLQPGGHVRLKRGQTFVGELKIGESGTTQLPIVVGAFGDGPQPIITAGGDCVEISGSNVVVHGVQLHDCSWAGVQFATGASFNLVAGNLITGNIAGVQVDSGASNNRVIGNQIIDNTKMSRLSSEPANDDSGAFGVLLNGDMNEVAYNVISGHDTFSYDYGRDGAAVEVYGGQSNRIHHNLGLDNHAFSELGNSRSSGNSYVYNVVTSSLANAMFIVTRGPLDGHGPILGTSLVNNTVVLTGADSQGFVCHAGCDSSILSVHNNIIQASWKAGYADGAISEDHNLYYRGQVQFTIGPNSMIGDPRFTDPAGGILNLRADSPAIDAGVLTSETRDFEGRTVPLDGDGDQSAVTDIGAYEYSPPGGSAPTSATSTGHTGGEASTPADKTTLTPALEPTPPRTAPCARNRTHSASESPLYPIRGCRQPERIVIP